MNLKQHSRLLALAVAIGLAPALSLSQAVAEQPATAPGKELGQPKPPQAPTLNDAQDPLVEPGVKSGGTADPAAGAPPAPKADSGAAAKGSAALPTTKDVAVGAAVFGADGKKVGEVKGVKSEPSGAIHEIHVKTGGLLGIGGKIVVVPAAKISKGGQAIQLAMTSEEVGKLPAMTSETQG